MLEKYLIEAPPMPLSAHNQITSLSWGMRQRETPAHHRGPGRTRYFPSAGRPGHPTDAVAGSAPTKRGARNAKWQCLRWRDRPISSLPPIVREESSSRSPELGPRAAFASGPPNPMAGGDTKEGRVPLPIGVDTAERVWPSFGMGDGVEDRAGARSPPGGAEHDRRARAWSRTAPAPSVTRRPAAAVLSAIGGCATWSRTAPAPDRHQAALSAIAERGHGRGPRRRRASPGGPQRRR